MGAPLGNTNGAKAKLWSAAIHRALEARGSRLDQKNALDELAGTLLDKAAEGDMSALKEIGDRLDGKAAQSVAIGNEGDSPFMIEEIVRTIVRPANPHG